MKHGAMSAGEPMRPLLNPRRWRHVNEKGDARLCQRRRRVQTDALDLESEDNRDNFTTTAATFFLLQFCSAALLRPGHEKDNGIGVRNKWCRSTELGLSTLGMETTRY